MNDAEFRALVAAGPAVVMVEKGHMIALLNERDRLAAALREIAEADPVELALDPQWPQRIAHAVLAPTRTEGGEA